MAQTRQHVRHQGQVPELQRHEVGGDGHVLNGALVEARHLWVPLAEVIHHQEPRFHSGDRSKGDKERQALISCSCYSQKIADSVFLQMSAAAKEVRQHAAI